jgi:hypothetical protein
LIISSQALDTGVLIIEMYLVFSSFFLNKASADHWFPSLSDGMSSVSESTAIKGRNNSLETRSVERKLKTERKGDRK